VKEAKIISNGHMVYRFLALTKRWQNNDIARSHPTGIPEPEYILGGSEANFARMSACSFT
jgi:hypothetical protein